MIKRPEYMSQLLNLRDKQIIKVITGVRRCGKSTLLDMYRTHLIESGVHPDHVVFINFEDFDNSAFRDPMTLHDHIIKRLSDDTTTYVILDEIQNVEQFPAVVDSLFLRKNIDLYVTGSNAFMLSGEIATYLSGRYIEIRMLPLSFAEYVSFTGSSEDLGRKYTDFLRDGGFPYTTELRGDRKLVRDYLTSVYSTVVLKDVIGHHRIADTMMLESLIRFVFDNIGNLLSTKKISDTMAADGRKIDVKTVERYLTALMDSFIVYQAKRYDVKGRQYLKTNDKYYAVDIGLRGALLGEKGADVGRMLENVLYLELIRRGYQVFVGKAGDTEVDFVAMNEKGISYFQAAATVRDANTLERELRPLHMIRDHYPKHLITLDDDPEADYDGIRRINALDFLIKRTE